MGFKIVDSYENMYGQDMQTVKCTICGHTETIYDDQDFPCDCVGCLGRQHADE